MIVKKVNTTLTVAGGSFPVLSYQLILSINQLPQLTVTISMGSDIKNEGAEPVDVSKITEGAKVVFNSSVTGQDIKFEGTVKHTGLNVKLSNVANSSASFTMTAESSLSALGGLPVMDRMFVGAGKLPRTSIDDYRGDLSSKSKSDALKDLASDVFTTKGFNDLFIKSGTSTIPGVVVKVLKLLYESEDKLGGAAGRQRDAAALAELTKLEDNIIGGVPNKPITDGADRSGFVMALIQGLEQSWGTSNGLDILIRAMNNIFFALMPQQNGKILLKQDCPVYQKEDYAIPPEVILGIDHSSTFSSTPTVGVRLRAPFMDYESMASDGDRNYYINYPRETEGGLYEYVDSSQYAMWFKYASAYDQRKDGSGKGVPKSVNHVADKAKPRTEQKNKDAKPPETKSMTDAWLEIGKAIYAMQKWSKSGIVLNVAHDPKINTGDIVKIDLTQAPALADSIPRGVYFGRVQTLSFSGSSGNVAMQAQVEQVRNAEDNEEYGFKEYPVYEAPK